MNVDAKIYVILGILTTAIAQISLKIASAHTVMQIKWTMWLLLSLIIYAISFLSYYMALRFFDISKIQPIMMAGIIALIALYGYATGEDFNRLRLAGVMLAVMSIVLISKS